MLWILRVIDIEIFYWWLDLGNGERIGGGREEIVGVWELDRGGVLVLGAGFGFRGKLGGRGVIINRYIDLYRVVLWGEICM